VKNNGTVRGQVKWFDTTKGFGFIVADGCKTEILLHANVLQSFGRNSIASNAVIEVVVQQTDRGCQATEILKIEPPAVSAGSEVYLKILGEGVEIDPSAPLKPARVKWFDRQKGFGFVNIFGSAEDVFVHVEILHTCGLTELMPGEAVSVRTATGPRGLMVWDVQVWDHVLVKAV
jgi:cold shock protein